MSADLATLPAPSLTTKPSNPFETARLALIKQLLTLKAPSAYPSFPSPSDHNGIAQHIRDAAEIFDGWLSAIGAEVRDNAVTSISAGLFAGTFAASISDEAGSADEQGEALIEFAAERRAAGGRW